MTDALAALLGIGVCGAVIGACSVALLMIGAAIVKNWLRERRRKNNWH